MDSSIYNPNTTYYICSFGGCGSWMLSKYLANFGKIEHIHSRNPPEKLTYVGSNNDNDNSSSSNVYFEWFNDIEIDDNNIQNYKVIYIYKNPIKAIYSRFVYKKSPNIKHLQHIQCDFNGDIKLIDVINSGKDLYKIEEFFDNYTNNNIRNYQIYCVKYDEFWENIELFNNTLNLPDIKELYPKKEEITRIGHYNNELNQIYTSLIQKMNKMNFIEIK